MWVNGQRRIRARSPNEGFFYTAGKAPPTKDAANGKPVSSARSAFRFQAGDLRRFSQLDEAVVVVYQSWEVGHQRIESIDETKRFVTFRSPLPWPFDYWGGRVRYFIENVPEALDAAGEWYLDRKSGLLTYIPLPGEDLSTATGYANIGHWTTEADIAAGRKIANLIRASDTPALSEDAGFSLMAGRPAITNPTQLLNLDKKGLFKGDELVRMIEAREFGLIVLRAQFYPDRVLQAISRRYDQFDTVVMNGFNYLLLHPKPE